eukprot:CAMPEP_0119053584 /NCGR_PEP_ID=MMETSP1177-20130426/74517_1 /TAXON_ID=2985 /ORGANISM="Ochromonas sp, Strain CCMP1899" /LENGTH=359 /DNA_ID=CAMNT_0007033571 /DNA_START=1838 /DNA_END=2917 /DNA_ORIENTATION=-
MTNEGANEGGYLLSLPRGVASTGDKGNGNIAKRDIWCVLIDRCFLSYSESDNLKPKSQLDLRNCYVTPLEGGIFSVSEIKNISAYASKTYYFMGKNDEDGAKWFYKLYTQSASNTVLKYSNLNFKLGSVCHPFMMSKGGGDNETTGYNNSPRTISSMTLNSKNGKLANKFARRVSPILTAFRNDPMLAFVFKKNMPEFSLRNLSNNRDFKSGDSLDMTGSRGSSLVGMMAKMRSRMSSMRDLNPSLLSSRDDLDARSPYAVAVTATRNVRSAPMNREISSLTRGASDMSMFDFSTTDIYDVGAGFLESTDDHEGNDKYSLLARKRISEMSKSNPRKGSLEPPPPSRSRLAGKLGIRIFN